MNFGIRKPSLKKSVSARLSGAGIRKTKSLLIPGYGKKGAGMLKDPKRSIYNKVYNKTTVGLSDVLCDNSKKTLSKKKRADSNNSGCKISVKQYDNFNTTSYNASRSRNTPNTNSSNYALATEIRKKRDLLKLAISEVKKSDKLSTVLDNFDKAQDFLLDLMMYTNEDFRVAKVSFSVPIEDQYKKLKENKEKLFNQAIKRAFKKEVSKASTLKTLKGRENKILRFYDSFQYSSNLTDKNKEYFKSLCDDYIQKNQIEKRN